MCQASVLEATTKETEKSKKIVIDEFLGTFVYLLILGM